MIYQSDNLNDIKELKRRGLSEPASMTTLIIEAGPLHFGWRAVHPLTLDWQTTCNNFILGGFKKKSSLSFELFFSNPFYKPTKPLSRTCNPFSSSPSCIFSGPNTLVSNISRSTVHNFIYNTIVHSNVSSIH
jgi:hypothetical protein